MIPVSKRAQRPSAFRVNTDARSLAGILARIINTQPHISSFINGCSSACVCVCVLCTSPSHVNSIKWLASCGGLQVAKAVSSSVARVNVCIKPRELSYNSRTADDGRRRRRPTTIHGREARQIYVYMCPYYVLHVKFERARVTSFQFVVCLFVNKIPSFAPRARQFTHSFPPPKLECI